MHNTFSHWLLEELQCARGCPRARAHACVMCAFFARVLVHMRLGLFCMYFCVLWAHVLACACVLACSHACFVLACLFCVHAHELMLEVLQARGGCRSRHMRACWRAWMTSTSWTAGW